jgi:hypothetical protein
MDHFDAFGLEKVGNWNEVSVRRNENSHIIGINPSKANHVLHNACVDTFFLGSSHIGPTLYTVSNFSMASGAFGIALFSLPGQKCRMYARSLIQPVGEPVSEFHIFRFVWIVRTVDVHALKRSCDSSVNDLASFPRENICHRIPIYSEIVIMITQRQREVPEVDKDSDSDFQGRLWGINHWRPQNIRGCTRHPRGHYTRFAVSDKRAVPRGVVMRVYKDWTYEESINKVVNVRSPQAILALVNLLK